MTVRSAYRTAQPESRLLSSPVRDGAPEAAAWFGRDASEASSAPVRGLS